MLTCLMRHRILMSNQGYISVKYAHIVLSGYRSDVLGTGTGRPVNMEEAGPE
jgi:hypothetical protein